MSNSKGTSTPLNPGMNFVQATKAIVFNAEGAL